MNTYQIEMSADICENAFFLDLMWVLEDLLVVEIDMGMQYDGAFNVLVML